MLDHGVLYSISRLISNSISQDSSHRKIPRICESIRSPNPGFGLVSEKGKQG